MREYLSEPICYLEWYYVFSCNFIHFFAVFTKSHCTCSLIVLLNQLWGESLEMHINIIGILNCLSQIMSKMDKSTRNIPQTQQTNDSFCRVHSSFCKYSFFLFFSFAVPYSVLCLPLFFKSCDKIRNFWFIKSFPDF